MTDPFLRYSKVFTEQIDPEREGQSHAEQLIAGWLFDHFQLHTLDVFRNQNMSQKILTDLRSFL